MLLAQLKTVELITEAIQLAFFRLVEYIWSISISGFDNRLKMARNKDLSPETPQSILVLRNEGYSIWEIAKKLKISYNAVYYSLHKTEQTGSNQNRKRSGRPRCTTEQEDKYISVSSLRNTSPQLAASLNSTNKTPVSMSTVKRRLRDAGLLGRVTKKKQYLRLANKKKRLRWAREHKTLDRGNTLNFWSIWCYFKWDIFILLFF